MVDFRSPKAGNLCDIPYMAPLLLIVGFSLFLLGIGYLFMPQVILRFNAFVRDTFLKDSIVLLSHRRVGIILLLISFIVLTLTLRYKPIQ